MAANYSGLAAALGYSRLAVVFGEHASQRFRERRIGRFGGLPQRLGRGMQQPIGQRIGEIVDDLVGGISAGQHAPGLLHGLQADRIRLVAQRPNGRVPHRVRATRPRIAPPPPRAGAARCRPRFPAVDGSHRRVAAGRRPRTNRYRSSSRDRGLDIARDSEVHHEYGAMAACPYRCVGRLLGDERAEGSPCS